MPKKIRVFVSYSHMDSEYLEKDSLLGFLRGLEKKDIEFLTDKDIEHGQLWDSVIRVKLHQTDIALVLISQYFLDSDYINNTEINTLLANQVYLMPIILSPCDWRQHEWIRKRQCLPANDKTIEEHYNDPGSRKRLFLEIREQLRKRAEYVKKQSRRRAETEGKSLQTIPERYSENKDGGYLPPLVNRTSRDQFYDGTEGPEMVAITGGEFLMGSPKEEAGRCSDEKQTLLEVEDFWVSVTLVTVEEYQRFCKETGRLKLDNPRWGWGHQPIVDVNWFDAVAYTEWLSQTTGGKSYRLLTESEWEYAARAGTQTPWSFGKDENKADAFAWYSANSQKRPHPVSTKKPNPWGLYDMHGNVWEWTCSVYSQNHNGGQVNCASISDYRQRVIRGGSFFYDQKMMRSAKRSGYNPRQSFSSLGFRVGRYDSL